MHHCYGRKAKLNDTLMAFKIWSHIFKNIQVYLSLSEAITTQRKRFLLIKKVGQSIWFIPEGLVAPIQVDVAH